MIPKVSIVVPIYKVEDYLRRCLDSLVFQTYSNLEVILVNDGSPDTCGDIAEEYARDYSFVCVIHKENGGLSDARNAGMKKITGELAMFVDSDDWMDRDAVKEMVKLMVMHDADVVQSAFYYAYDSGCYYDNRYFNKDSEEKVLNHEETMKELIINEKIKNFAWGKLFKTSFIKDEAFRINVLFEDVFWTHHILKKVKTYVLCHQPFYYYQQRNDSIVKNYSLKNLDIVTGLKERHEFVEQYYPHLRSNSLEILLKTELQHYQLLVMNRPKKKEREAMKKMRKEIVQLYRETGEELKSNHDLILQLRLFSIHPLLHFSWLAGRKIIRIASEQNKRLEVQKL